MSNPDILVIAGDESTDKADFTTRDLVYGLAGVSKIFERDTGSGASLDENTLGEIASALRVMSCLLEHRMGSTPPEYEDAVNKFAAADTGGAA